MELFEKATKQRLRFKGQNGVLNTEDLWSLTLPNLDFIAKDLNKQIQDKEVSFIGDTSEEDKILNLKFEVVKHIIGVKLEEKEAAKVARQNLERRKMLMEALADKRVDAVKNMSEADILKELETLK